MLEVGAAHDGQGRMSQMAGQDPDHEFWSQRDELRHIRDFARSRRASPYATLGCVMRRATACVEPNVVLPPTIGGVASVNLYTTQGGYSGAGKGTSDAAGFDAVRLLNHSAESLDADRPNPGSGEGLARLFKGRGDERGITRAHLMVPEVSTLEALAGRQGSTLTSELLKAFMGEPLGFSNASKDTTTAIAAQSYRLCLGVGVQPENAGFFLSREKDGFPQRFLWMPTDDPYAPRERLDPIDPMDIVVPDFGKEPFQVEIPDEARDQIDEHRWLVLTGKAIEAGIDPLDSHLMLTRLKVAFALAVLAQRGRIEATDWKLAGELVTVSTRVRSSMRAAVDERFRRENTAKAHAQADRDGIVEDRAEDRLKRNLRGRILRRLEKVDSATLREIRHSVVDAKTRQVFNPVMDDLLEEGLIAEIDSRFQLIAA